MSTSNPDQVYYELYEAIRLNKRPCVMLKQYIDSRSLQANILSKVIFGNTRALALLTSPQGRDWLHRWLDDTLNYLEQMSRMSQK